MNRFRKYGMFLLILVIGCSSPTEEKKEEKQITGVQIAGQPEVEYIISMVNTLDYSEQVLRQGIIDFSDTISESIEAEHPLFLNIQSDISSNRILLLPGYQVKLSLNDDPTSFYGSTARIQNTILALQQAEESFFEDPPYYQLDPDQFETRFKNVERRTAGILDDLSRDTFSGDVINLLSNLSQAKLDLMKVNYYLSNRSDKDLSDNSFFANIFEVNRDYEDLLEAGSWEYATLLQVYLEENLIPKIRSDNSDIDKAKLAKRVSEEISNLEMSSQVKSFLSAKNIAYFLAQVGPTDEIAMLYDAYLDEFPDSDYSAALNKTYDQWRTIAPGQPAPELITTNLEGDTVRLSDFIGSYVYIDVWATWCGPCINEFKHYPVVKNNEAVQLFISVDQDRSKWENFIKKDAPDGVHVIESTTDIGNDIWQKYKIESIPRYIVIDPEGRIVDPVAPRPSDPQVRTLFTNDLTALN